MGSTPEEQKWAVSKGEKRNSVAREGPPHRVTFAEPFALSRAEVTRGEFARFREATNRDMPSGCFDFDKDGKWVVDEEQELEVAGGTGPAG